MKSLFIISRASGKIKNYYISIFLLFSLSTFSQNSDNQDEKLNVLGKIYNQEEPFPGVEIKVSQDSIDTKKIYTNAEGAYSFDLTPDHYYLIEVSKKGYYSKFFSVDTKIFPRSAESSPLRKSKRICIW